MQIIRDIRLYKSEIENIDGNRPPMSFMSKENNIAIERIVWKLHEIGFSFDNFNHLYINLTPCIPPETFEFSKRSPNLYYKFYRYVDYGITADEFKKLESFKTEYFAEKIEKLLCEMFAKIEVEKDGIRSCINSAITEKEKMCAKYKEKKSATLTAEIYMRITENGLYSPLLTVKENSSGNEILRTDLPLCNELSVFGTIQLSNKRIKINPRKNAYSEGLKAIIIEF